MKINKASFILVTSLGLLAGCGSQDSNDTSTQSNNQNNTYSSEWALNLGPATQVTITPDEAWYNTTGKPIFFHGSLQLGCKYDIFAEIRVAPDGVDFEDFDNSYNVLWAFIADGDDETFVKQRFYNSFFMQPGDGVIMRLRETSDSRCLANDNSLYIDTKMNYYQTLETYEK